MRVREQTGFAPGVEVGGRYQLSRPLGTGGFSEVWEAHDSLNRCRVAIKFLHPDAIMDKPVMLLKFHQEAQIGVDLVHPGITRVENFGEYPFEESEGAPKRRQWYLVMEFLEGWDLAKTLQYEGVFSVHRLAAVGARAADALAFAHAAGVVHRDLKPANIMLLPGDQPKICDFGIAHLTQQVTDHTLNGSLMGTPAFMAPEQWERENVDARADLYAFGGILYQLSTGEPPFKATDGQRLAYQHLHVDPVPPGRLRPDLPPAFEELVLDLLTKDRDERHRLVGDAADVARRLRTLDTATGRRRRRRRHRPPPRTGPRRPVGLVLVRHRTGLIAAAAVSAAAVAALTVPPLLEDDASAPRVELARALADGSGETLASDPATAARLAVTAWKVSPVEEALAALLARYNAVDQGVLAGEDGETLEPVLSKDGSLLATRSGHDVRLWDMTTRRQITGRLKGHTGDVLSVAISPNGRLIATAGDDGTVRLWNRTTGAQSGAPLSVPASQVVFLDDDSLAVLSGSGSVFFWNTADHTRTHTLSITGPGSGGSSAAAMSPDGSLVAVVSDPGATSVAGRPSGRRVTLWDLRAHARLTAPDLPGDVSLSAAFTADGASLIGLDGRSRTVLWDVRARRLTRTAARSSEFLQVGPDGSPVALLEHSRIRIVDPGTGDLTVGLAVPGGSIAHAAAFTRDGTLLVGAGQGAPSVWRLKPDPSPPAASTMVTLVCSLGGGDMTAEDWNRYAPGADHALGADACA